VLELRERHGLFLSRAAFRASSAYPTRRTRLPRPACAVRVGGSSYCVWLAALKAE